MGNTIVCSIHLVHGYTLQAGDPFTGKVLVTVRKRIPAFPAYLIIEGSEGHFENQELFFKRQVNLSSPTWTGILKPAQYELPFNILLPASLPSSVSNRYCEISYFAAFLGSKRSDRRVQLASLDFTVRAAPLPTESAPLVVSPQTFDISLAGIKLLKRGQITLAVRLGSSHVGKGNFLTVYFAGYNSSKRDITRVVVELFETTLLICPQNPCLTVKTKKRIHLKPNSFSVPGRTNTDDPNVSEEERCRIVRQRLEVGGSSLAVKIPVDAEDSYEGYIIKVTHTLRIKFLTGALSTNPRIEIPLRIGRAPVVVAPAAATAPFCSQTMEGVEQENAVNSECDIPVVFGESSTPTMRIGGVSGEPDIPIPTALAMPVTTGVALMERGDVIVLGGDTIVYPESAISSLDDYLGLEVLPVPSNRDSQEARG